MYIKKIKIKIKNNEKIIKYRNLIRSCEYSTVKWWIYILNLNLNFLKFSGLSFSLVYKNYFSNGII